MSQYKSETSPNNSTKNKKSYFPPYQTAIPFVTFDSITKKFIINDEAKKLLSRSENKQIGIVSLVGKYRTGKSFLLNRVLIEKKYNKGFEVAPTIKPCTKGIWIWTSPIMVSNKNSSNCFPAFLIDTEGLGAYDEEINHDSKIFLIAILISSLFIYNSFGTIDEVALNNLSLILNLSKSLKLRNNSNVLNTKENDDKEMSKYFPSLLWLLRDFALKLEDSDGNVITAKQYLENALLEQKEINEIIEEKNLVRKMIKTYFVERDCFPMVRPVENENDLQNLMNLPDNKIRPEFIKQSTMLKNKIYMKIKPKTFNGKILSGQMLINLLESVVNAINEGAIPVIENSWNYIANNELLKSIKEYTEYFRKNILIYQKENLTKNDFFNELQKYSQNLIDDIINKFKEENEKKFENINEFVHKLKLSLNQEFKKLNEENIILIKDKYILDLDKEINNIIKDKEKLIKTNYINFISNLLQIKYKLDTSIPNFSLKDQISYEKIIETIKKYIEEYFIKSRNLIEQKNQQLKNDFQYLETKYKSLNDEYNKDKTEYKATINNYNDMLIEVKLKLKNCEDKIKNFENEKKTIKETNELNIKSKNKNYEDKIDKLNMEINKLKNELKTKEEELLVYKLNNEKILALNEQKINFLEKESNQWKERYNTQGKELSENKRQIININSDLDKIKNENRNLKNKIDLGGGTKNDDINRRATGNNFYVGNNMNNLNLNSASSKILVELLSGQNIIKDYIKDIIDKTNELLENNNNLNGDKQSHNARGSKNIISTSANKRSKEVTSNNNYNTKTNLHKSSNYLVNLATRKEEKDNNEAPTPTKNNNIDYTTFNNTTKLPSSYSLNNNNSILEIKIVNSILKKDVTGKPFLEYICNIKNGSDIYSINKKFGHFMLLHKAIKNSVKDGIKLPESGNLFISINDMKQNSFHENKLGQLDKYINDLLKIEQVISCAPFRNFFELDDSHDNINKIRKNKTIMEKRKFGKYSTNTLQRNFEDFDI